MTPSLKLEIENLIKELNLNCSIDEFSNKFNWQNVHYYNQGFSEQFIREFSNKVNWTFIFYNQKLNKEFIEEFYEILKSYLNEEEKSAVRKVVNKKEFEKSFETAINNLTKNKLQTIE